ncbi:hypothetical protein BJV74DRAFT_853565, partial [Russula compacta]
MEPPSTRCLFLVFLPTISSAPFDPPISGRPPHPRSRHLYYGSHPCIGARLRTRIASCLRHLFAQQRRCHTSGASANTHVVEEKDERGRLLVADGRSDAADPL